MSDAPLVPAPVYGLRTWAVLRDGGGERLAAPQRGVAWPAGGAWLTATCTRPGEHAAPAPGCACGVHAWHPSRRAARRVLAVRREVPGVVEARGAIEVHEDGFRAERARPHALVLARGRNAPLARRLAAAYGVPLVEVGGADDLFAFCRERGLGLAPSVVADLLGPAEVEQRRRARRRRVRADALRVLVAVVVAALLVVVGLQVATDPPGPRVLNGRTGEVHVP